MWDRVIVETMSYHGCDPYDGDDDDDDGDNDDDDDDGNNNNDSDDNERLEPSTNTLSFYYIFSNMDSLL